MINITMNDTPNKNQRNLNLCLIAECEYLTAVNRNCFSSLKCSV